MLKDFIRFCEQNLDQSFAQNFQDLFGLWAAGARRDGYFVEFGALNGRSFSNSYMLEKLGWTGIVSEPHPDYAKHIKACRSCHFSPLCVYDSTGDTVPFRIVTGRPAMSGIGETQLNDDKAELRNNYREVSVGTITLNDLLDQFNAPETIDFISIDTEGSEERILKAFDFSKRKVKVFCIEHNYVQRDAIAKIMEAQGYRRVFPALSGHDDWWVLDSAASEMGTAPIKISDYFAEVFDNNLEERRNHLKRFAARLEN